VGRSGINEGTVRRSGRDIGTVGRSGKACRDYGEVREGMEGL